MRQSRWKSLTALRATLALLIFVGKTYFNYEIPGIDTVIDLVCVLLVAYGIYNDPTDKYNY